MIVKLKYYRYLNAAQRIESDFPLTNFRPDRVFRKMRQAEVKARHMTEATPMWFLQECLLTEALP